MKRPRICIINAVIALIKATQKILIGCQATFIGHDSMIAVDQQFYSILTRYLLECFFLVILQLNRKRFPVPSPLYQQTYNTLFLNLTAV